MYSVTIRDHIMIAHSLNNEVFGPAQKLHGATYVVDVVFFSKELDENKIVIDIALAHNILKETLSPLNYENLDDLPELKNQLTTTEFMAKYIHDKVREKASSVFKGKIKVTLGESHVAWASYEGDFG